MNRYSVTTSLGKTYIGKLINEEQLFITTKSTGTNEDGSLSEDFVISSIKYSVDIKFLVLEDVFLMQPYKDPNTGETRIVPIEFSTYPHGSKNLAININNINEVCIVKDSVAQAFRSEENGIQIVQGNQDLSSKILKKGR
jgi:hypothetical protein